MGTADPPRGPPTRVQRFARTMRTAALFSVSVAALTIAMVMRGSDELYINMMIAAAIGVGFGVLLAVGLMTLIFLSNKSGHDADAASPPSKKDSE